jgi:alkanesulfonate monooxygenase SsuD/methylene tetrahydromethanopterin reductase-like flavin-dependent oxidoreductase (luciferase family)
VGLGGAQQWDFGLFGEAQDNKIRAAKLDEGLDILTGLWSGEPFSYQGEHYRLDEVVFRPRPLQTPRIPIWVAGFWPNKGPLRRAARWDGVFPLLESLDRDLTPQEWREILAYIGQHRSSSSPFAVVHSGATPGDDLAKAAALIEPYREAGVNWWMEPVDPWRFGADIEANGSRKAQN